MKPREILQSEVEAIIGLEEGHFADLKSKDISPSKITRTISAFANADGGEIFIGIEDEPRQWRGFSNFEDANGLIQALEKLFPLGNGFDYTFLRHDKCVGYVLKVEIQKSHDVCVASDRTAYVRRGAQNLPQNDQPSLERLKRNKGIASFETELLNCDPEIIIESEVTERFVNQVIPSADQTKWLKKQQLIREHKPTVAGVMLFAEEPQALLPKRSGIKIYRYQTREESERAVLVYDPLTIE